MKCLELNDTQISVFYVIRKSELKLFENLWYENNLSYD